MTKSQILARKAARSKNKEHATRVAMQDWNDARESLMSLLHKMAGTYAPAKTIGGLIAQLGSYFRIQELRVAHAESMAKLQQEAARSDALARMIEEAKVSELERERDELLSRLGAP